MSPFEQVLQIAQEQLAAVSRGDLASATDRIDERGVLLAAAPAPRLADRGTIEEILRLDRVLSGAIRDRMIAIRTEAGEGHRGQVALQGYGHAPPPRARVLDAVG